MDDNRALIAGVIAMLIAAPVIGVAMDDTALGIGFGAAIAVIVYLGFGTVSGRR
ncbi:MAG: hypothetical protein AB7J35_21595 [Dehalococcoidia bacterium]